MVGCKIVQQNIQRGFRFKFKSKNIQSFSVRIPSDNHSSKGVFWTIIQIFLIFVIIALTIQAQENKISSEFLPIGLNFSPLKANIQEAKMGILFFPDNRNLKVDIGNNIDLLKINFPGNNISIASGIEFMGYALSTKYLEFRLQIKTLDGFFGGNISFKKIYPKGEFSLRLRLIHNSAHLVDGDYDFIRKFWINNDSSMHFTRNFYELTAAHQLNTSSGRFKYYGGFSHSFFVRPADIKRINLFAGFELSFKNLFGPVFNKEENVFLASHFSLAGYHEYIGSQQTMFGMKFGYWEGKGITVYLSYYTGINYFDAYYGERIMKFGTGFYIDFP